jgi:hypothetical protein
MPAVSTTQPPANIIGYSIRSLFDPTQTHAAYAVPDDQVDLVKGELKKLGATYFRLVRNKDYHTRKRSGTTIVCFKFP